MKILVRMAVVAEKVQISGVAMAAVWMMLTLPVSVFQDSLEILVLPTLMNVKQLCARMGNAKTLSDSMLFSAFATLDGLEFSVILT